MEIKEHKVYKGINKEIRFLFLERNIAMQFLGCCAMLVLIILMFFRVSMVSLGVTLGIIGLIYSYFKKKDLRNQKHNIRKEDCNKRKPDLIRTKSMIILKNDRSFFN